MSWVMLRRGLQLRKPSRPQAAEMAEPLTRILMRHVDVAQFGPDVVDVAALAAAAGDYAGDGPLVLPATHQPVSHQVGEDQHP